jgi:hypothetical protein
MSHPTKDGVQRQMPALEVHLIDHLDLAAAVAFHPQEPRGKGVERLCQRLVGA